MKSSKLLLLLLSIIVFIVGCSKSNRGEDGNNSDTKVVKEKLPKDAVVSIHNKIYTKKDFPKEYSELKYNGKKRFLSRYIYLQVVLDSLKDKEKIYKDKIEQEITKNIDDLKRKGVILEGLEKFISNLDITFNTIAYQEVLKKHKEIEKEINDFYKKHEKAYNYPDMIEIAHISTDNKEEADKILQELRDKNATIETFAKYVEKYSKDLKTISSGGYIGNMSQKELNQEFFSNAWKSQENRVVSTLLKLKDTKYYHIVYLFKKIPSHKASIKDEREKIINFLLAKEIKRWKLEHFSKANKNSKVKVYDIKVDI
jgi:hypothetical protein